jgi:hypothetical protein
VGLTALSSVLLLELVSKFLIFLCQHIVVIKQTILGLLASLLRCCIIVLDMIVGECSGVIYPFPSIVHTEVATVCMQDDVIIINIRVASSMWSVIVN